MSTIVFNWWFGLSQDAKDFLKTVAGPGVAILIFTTTQVTQAIVGWNKDALTRRRMVIGLYKEIKDNLDYGKVFLQDTTIKKDVIDKILADDQAATAAGKPPSYRPLIIITESRSFYDGISSSLPEIRRRALVAVIGYYRSVLDQKQVADAIVGASFLCVSAAGRCGTIDDLWTAFTESQTRGTKALELLAASYPRRWFQNL